MADPLPVDLERRNFVIRCCQGVSAALIPARLLGLTFSPGFLLDSRNPASPEGEFHLHPRYRAQLPLEATLLKTQAGLDNFVTEKYADQIAAVLAEWSADLLQASGELRALEKVFSPNFSGSSFRRAESRLVRRETPRLCRGGSKSLTAPAVCLQIQTPRPPALWPEACDFDFGSRQGPFEGPATRKASGSAGGYLLRPGRTLEVLQNKFSGEMLLGRDAFLQQLRSAMSSFSNILTADFQVVAIEATVGGVVTEGKDARGSAGEDAGAMRIPDRLRTRVRYELVGSGKDFYREQRVGNGNSTGKGFLLAVDFVCGTGAHWMKRAAAPLVPFLLTSPRKRSAAILLTLLSYSTEPTTGAQSSTAHLA